MNSGLGRHTLSAETHLQHPRPHPWLRRTARAVGSGLAGLITAVLLTGPAWAALDVPKPRPKPPAIVLKTLPADQRDALSDALKEAGAHNWRAMRQHMTRLSDPLARTLAEWAYVSDSRTDASFDAIAAFLSAHPDWPRAAALQANAEEAMPDTMAPGQIIDWFSAHPPVTGHGMIRLGEALLARGETEAGTRWIRQGWIEGDFDRDEDAKIRTAHVARLDAATHEARLDRLLWDGHGLSAGRMLNLVPAEAAALAKARLDLAEYRISPATAEQRVAAHLRDHPGLLYGRIRYLRGKGQDEATWPLLAAAPTTAEEMVRPEKWWVERHLQIRKALKEGAVEEAYAMAAGHGLSEGGDFADAAWLSGWIALRHLGQPEAALAHFRELEQGVGYPISKARAWYWMGRAAAALGNTAEARVYYGNAAAFPFTFYGQLAAEEVPDLTPALTLPAVPEIDPARRSAFLETDRVRAIEMLIDADADYLAALFTFDLADDLTSPEEMYVLGDHMMGLNQTHFGVRVGKKALLEQTVFTDLAYPIRSLSAYEGRRDPPEEALALGLTRQESEFNALAVSYANAHGLMQILPATAQETARLHGLPYQRSWLRSRPDYNTQIGRAHLSDLLRRFDGSYIMAIAAYNAGAHRVSTWVDDYGDPRAPGVDAIDWIETIPFRQTRNYVQRVLENTIIYRHRLSGLPAAFSLSADLDRPARALEVAELTRAAQTLDLPVELASAVSAPATVTTPDMSSAVPQAVASAAAPRADDSAPAETETAPSQARAQTQAVAALSSASGPTGGLGRAAAPTASATSATSATPAAGMAAAPAEATPEPVSAPIPAPSPDAESVPAPAADPVTEPAPVPEPEPAQPVSATPRALPPEVPPTYRPSPAAVPSDQSTAALNREMLAQIAPPSARPNPATAAAGLPVAGPDEAPPAAPAGEPAAPGAAPPPDTTGAPQAAAAAPFARQGSEEARKVLSLDEACERWPEVCSPE